MLKGHPRQKYKGGGRRQGEDSNLRSTEKPSDFRDDGVVQVTKSLGMSKYYPDKVTRNIPKMTGHYRLAESPWGSVLPSTPAPLHPSTCFMMYPGFQS